MNINHASTIAAKAGITPDRCSRCRQSEGNFRQITTSDQGDDVGYECQACGKVQFLTAGWVKRKARA